MVEEEEGDAFGSKSCVKDNCYQYDESGAHTIDECNGPEYGTCALDSFTKEMKCTCQGNYNSSTQCTSCIYSFTLESNCTQCLPGYDIDTKCFQCEIGRDIATSCTTCLEGYDPATGCSTCMHGKDPLTRCMQCPSGLVEGANGDCTQANTSGSDTALTVVIVIISIVAVVVIVAVVLYCMRKKHSLSYSAVMPTLDEVEPIAQDDDNDSQENKVIV